MIKTKLMRIFIYFLKKYFNWNAIQNYFIHKKKHFPVKKCIVLLGWQVFYQFFKSRKSQIITILGCSNDKNIYIYCEEYYFYWLVDFLYKFRHVQPTGFDPQHHAVPSEKFKKTKNLKLTLMQAKLQWHKCWRKQEERW